MEADTGKVASAKSVRLFPGLLSCSATFAEPPQMERELPPLRIVLAEGGRLFRQTKHKENPS
jgi:hypothetical protein